MAFELKVIFVLRVEHTKGNEEFVQAHAGFRRYADVVGPQVSLRSEKFAYNQGNQLFNMFQGLTYIISHDVHLSRRLIWLLVLMGGLRRVFSTLKDLNKFYCQVLKGK